VAISYEMSVATMRGAFLGAPAPRLLRPLIRTFFLKPVLKRGRFPFPARAPAAFQPSADPGEAAEVLARIRGASSALESAVTAETTAGRTTMDHPFFGTVSLADYVQLQAIHTDHHRGQLSS
jgi:uncharacterized damage-inducible protein DinB